jgi:hypothetical protein
MPAESYPRPKPPKRHKATRAEWERLRAEKLGPCRGCNTHLFLTLHHVVPRSLRGGDVAENLIPLCGSGTDGCHGAIQTRTPGWEHVAARVRARFTPQELAYVHLLKGPEFLERYYPAGLGEPGVAGTDGDQSSLRPGSPSSGGLPPYGFFRDDPEYDRVRDD